MQTKPAKRRCPAGFVRSDGKRLAWIQSDGRSIRKLCSAEESELHWPGFRGQPQELTFCPMMSDIHGLSSSAIPLFETKLIGLVAVA